MLGVLFAIIAALAMGLWTIIENQAADKIDYLFGATVVSITAAILGLIVIFPRLRTTTLFTDPKGIILAMLAGACALAIDYFAFNAYGAGVPISIASPIIIGGSILFATTIGLILGESITVIKIIGLILTISGVYILTGLAG